MKRGKHKVPGKGRLNSDLGGLAVTDLSDHDDIRVLPYDVTQPVGKGQVYLGLDLKHFAGRTHFFGHDFHSRNHEQTEFPRMEKMLTYGAKVLSGTGVKVYNCSPLTDLECFPKISYDEALLL